MDGLIPRSTAAALVLVLLVGTIGCQGDYAVRLPGGYELVSVHTGAVEISEPGDKVIVIDANVDGYSVIGPLIVGHVSRAELPPEDEVSQPGFFIVDTRTHEAKQGLDKTTWLESLRAAGVLSVPGLKKPTRFDRNYD